MRIILMTGLITIALCVSAQAQWRGGGGRGGGGWHHGGGGGGAIIGGVIGGIIGGAFAPRPYYPPQPYYPQPSYDPGIGYCMQRYRSYNPATGYFVGYDGYYHRCP